MTYKLIEDINADLIATVGTFKDLKTARNYAKRYLNGLENKNIVLYIKRISKTKKKSFYNI